MDEDVKEQLAFLGYALEPWDKIDYWKKTHSARKNYLITCPLAEYFMHYPALKSGQGYELVLTF